MNILQAHRDWQANNVEACQQRDMAQQQGQAPQTMHSAPFMAPQGLQQVSTMAQSQPFASSYTTNQIQQIATTTGATDKKNAAIQKRLSTLESGKVRNRKNSAEQRRKRKLSRAEDKEELAILRALVDSKLGEISVLKAKLNVYENTYELPKTDIGT
jgi:hypothetical protein